VKGTTRTCLIAGGALLFASIPAPAAADKPFVDRPLTLQPLHFSADAGLGVAQFEAFGVDPANPMNTVSLGNKVGAGLNLEAAIGLPFLGEFGARVGYRFDTIAAAAQADHFGRLFDPIVNDPGLDSFTNPELYLRGTVFDLEVVQLGLETRAIIPTAAGTDFGLTPGVPVRIHIPTLARIDSGIYLPLAFSQAPNGQNPTFAIEVPVQLFFQVEGAFFGPLTGLTWNSDGSSPDPVIMAGVGGGYTLAPFDFKAQIYTSELNADSWAKHIGGGIGVGLRVP
jgi:hypothetical protein